MADWFVERPADLARFPVIHHRHPNGTLAAVRDRTPSVTLDHQGRRVERWTYACACGELTSWDRRPPG